MFLIIILIHQRHLRLIVINWERSLVTHNN
nr:MAG TPA: hypothetical protein [Caudoviricetes sp.]